MIEPSLFALILITVCLLGLALFMNSRSATSTREERERSEIVAILRRIETALNHKSPESSANVIQADPTQNPKGRYEESN